MSQCRFDLTREIPRAASRNSVVGRKDSRARPSCPFGTIGLVSVIAFAMWRVAVADVIEVRSGNAILGMDAATGALVRFADTEAKLELGSGGQSLFRLVVILPNTDPGRPVELTSGDAKAVERVDGGGVRLRFERIGNRDLAAVCVVQAGADGHFQFRIQVTGESGTTVERLDYPVLPLAAPLDGDGGGNAMVLGTTKGGVLERPHQWKPGQSAAGTQPTVEPAEAVQVGAFRAADGSEAIIAVNAAHVTRQATLRWNGKSRSIELMPSEVKLLPPN
jgi:hypothetical protein